MKVLIAGASGYVGKNLCQKLDSAQIPYLTLNRTTDLYVLKNKLFDQNCASVIEMKGSLEGISLQIRNLGVTHLLNLAASTNKAADWTAGKNLVEANIAYSLNLAILAQTSEIPNYVFASTYSTNLFGETYLPQTLYAATKKAAEDLLYFFASINAFRLRVLNFYDIYGPNHPHQKVIPSMFHALQSGEKLLMTKGEQEICPVHIDDVTDALLATLNSNQENFFSHFDIHGPDKLQLKELLHIMESVSGRKWKTDQVQMSLPNREREIYFVNPKFGLPPYWQPKIDISEGLKTLMDENN